jgi:drug/metabolite transporter (DMT)-like permease
MRSSNDQTLGERTTAVTLWSSGLALVGVALMFAGSSISHALDGDLLALGMTVLMALMVITTRRSKSASSLPIAAISSPAGGAATMLDSQIPAGPASCSSPSSRCSASVSSGWGWGC